ncbi:MAG: DUF1289 domain-containing protein [Gammaproteobacteria bacterium]|nr:DUF1289 domain-containing protein [Gammaproteobacteria bacterium]MDD9896475.1 DUF1289 domain-containing protein [Gammaproteobacteria bacterium]MDD9959647.1 DUF1289 domain-containing protein [Gammaproteobacteria bacterium]
MNNPKTPCIGICSTTSLGDSVCRGCKRYSFEVINWNTYDSKSKTAVLKRIEKLNCQILESKLRIFSVPNLKLGLKRANVPFNEELSPYCWLHNLLKKNHKQIKSLKDYGAYVLPDFEGYSLEKLCQLVEQELLTLCQAHFERYYELPRNDADSASA